MYKRVLNKLSFFLKCHIDPLLAESKRTLQEMPLQTAVASQLMVEVSKSGLTYPPIRHFSQNDEDGIVLRILDRLGIREPATFLELGVSNGLENNTLILLALKWRGGWIGGEPLAFRTENSRLTFVQNWITAENCAALAKQALQPLNDLRDVKLASVDLDGNDYHVVSKLLKEGLAPDLFIVEYNAKFPAEAEFIMPYDPKHTWGNDDYFGASLKSWCGLFAANDYRLVACNLTGANAFFINKRNAKLFDDVSDEPSKLFRHGRYLTVPPSGHPLSARTVEQMIN